MQRSKLTTKDEALKALHEASLSIACLGADWTEHFEDESVTKNHRKWVLKDKKGLQYLTEQIQKISEQTIARSELIARDQTKKVHNTLTESRLKQNSMYEYLWGHSGGVRDPRKTHLNFNGKKFDLNHPPYDSEAKENVNPGQLINCYCFIVPLIPMSQIK